MAFMDSWDWGKIADAFGQTIVPAVSNIYGARQIADANQKAAEIARVNSGQNISTLTRANAPAMQYLQTVTAQDPNQLTPAQVQALQDAQRSVVTATPTGLRGSGRYLTASIGDVQNRMKQGMIQTNTARSDQANVQRGNLASNLGRAVTGENTAGNYADANAITATAGSNNMALQNIGSYFANSLKGVNSPYGVATGTPYSYYGAPNPRVPVPGNYDNPNKPLKIEAGSV